MTAEVSPRHLERGEGGRREEGREKGVICT